MGNLRSESQAPVVTSSTPVAGAVTSYLFGVQIQFDEDLDPSTVNAQTVQVLDAQGNLLPFNLQLFGRDVNLGFLNTIGNGRYEVRINGVGDILGNAVVNARWSVEVDASAPTVVSTSPANDAVNVDPMASIRIEFNEDLRSGDLLTQQFTLTWSGSRSPSGRPMWCRRVHRPLAM